MFDILLKCSYMVCFDIKDKDYIHKTFSGTIALAFSCLSRLIIPQAWNEQYKFQSVITYDTHETKPLITENLTTKDIQDISNELDILLGRRNGILDDIFIHR